MLEYAYIEWPTILRFDERAQKDASRVVHTKQGPLKPRARTSVSRLVDGFDSVQLLRLLLLSILVSVLGTGVVVWIVPRLAFARAENDVEGRADHVDHRGQHEHYPPLGLSGL